MKGRGPFLQDHPKDRPEEIFGCKVTLHGSGNRASYLLLPDNPPKWESGGFLITLEIYQGQKMSRYRIWKREGGRTM